LKTSTEAMQNNKYIDPHPKTKAKYRESQLDAKIENKIKNK
jgi:hypothetical protein